MSGVLWNNDNSAIPKSAQFDIGSGFSGRSKLKKPEKGGGSVSGILLNNKNTALAKNPPANAMRVAGLQVKVREADYKKKINANKLALPGIAPSRSSIKANEYARNMKQQWDYKHNPNSSIASLKTIAPSKADGRLKDYQGNTKMHKYSGSRLHPDTQFAHGKEDNVKEERSLLTNVKLFWARMFKKGNTQPDNLKHRGKKLEYDKKEKGLWAY